MEIVKNAQRNANEILAKHRKLLDIIAEELLKSEVLDMKEFEEMIGKYLKK